MSFYSNFHFYIVVYTFKSRKHQVETVKSLRVLTPSAGLLNTINTFFECEFPLKVEVKDYKL